MTQQLQLRTGEVIEIIVISNSKLQEIKEISGTYKVKLKARAIKGKANKELKEYFKSLGYVIEIVKGEKSNHKFIKIL
jgi:uncharacterized protein (TIGR00251 family)